MPSTVKQEPSTVKQEPWTKPIDIETALTTTIIAVHKTKIAIEIIKIKKVTKISINIVLVTKIEASAKWVTKK